MLLNFSVYWFFLVGITLWLLGLQLPAAVAMFTCASLSIILTGQEPEGD